MKKWMLAAVLSLSVGFFVWGNGHPDAPDLDRTEMDDFKSAFGLPIETNGRSYDVLAVPEYKTGLRDITKIEKQRNASIVVRDNLEAARRGRRDDFETLNKFLMPGIWIKFDYEGETYIRVMMANIDVYATTDSDSRERLPYNTVYETREELKLLKDAMEGGDYRVRTVGDAAVVTMISESGEVQDLPSMTVDVNAVKDQIEKFNNEFIRDYKDYFGVDYGIGEGTYSWFYLNPPEIDEDYLKRVGREVERAVTAKRPKDMIVDGNIFGTWRPIRELENRELMINELRDGKMKLTFLRWPYDDRCCNGY